MGIHLIVLRGSSQQSFVILNGQEGGRKEDRAPSPRHTLPKIFGRIHTEQLHKKSAPGLKLVVDHISLIKLIVNLQEMRNLKIKFQQFLFYRAVLMIFQIFIDYP